MVRGDGRERPIAPDTPVEAPPLSFAGALTLFDCQGPAPVLTLEGETTAKFVIDDPTAIVIIEDKRLPEWASPVKQRLGICEYSSWSIQP